MLIRKLENFLEGRIEGFFNKKFASSLRLDEIENRLSKEIFLKQRKEHKKIYIPDNYTIIVGDEDYQNLHCLDTYQQLYRFLLQAAIHKDFFFQNRIALQMSVNLIKEPGSFSIQALFQADGVAAKKTDEQSSGFVEQPDHTLVFQKNSLLMECSNYAHVNFARLAVSEGVSVDTSIDIGEKRIHIGRRENNELYIPDKNCSRLHCYITYENNRHVLHDAGSLNGTRLNRHLLCTEGQALRPGDKISIGNTVIVYEVD